jgi:hypothetical protein
VPCGVRQTGGKSDMSRRWSGTGAAAFGAGLGWVAKDLGGRFSPDPDYWNCNSSYDYLLNATDTIAFLLLVPALIGLFRACRSSTGTRHGPTAQGSAAGFGIAGIANVLEHCAGLEVLGFAYVTGLMVGVVLLLVFAWGLTRMDFLPTLSSWLLVMGTAAALLLANQGGFTVFGAAWIIMGSVLARGASQEQRL